MRLTPTVALAGFAAIALWAAPAAAQDTGLDPGVRAGQSGVAPQRVRPRIVVTPSGRLVRQCVDVYVVERRATGDTVVPDMRCRWAYR
jgi:hypothetical protein